MSLTSLKLNTLFLSDNACGVQFENVYENRSRVAATIDDIKNGKCINNFALLMQYIINLKQQCKTVVETDEKLERINQRMNKIIPDVYNKLSIMEENQIKFQDHLNSINGKIDKFMTTATRIDYLFDSISALKELAAHEKQKNQYWRAEVEKLKEDVANSRKIFLLLNDTKDD